MGQCLSKNADSICCSDAAPQKLSCFVCKTALMSNYFKIESDQQTFYACCFYCMEELDHSFFETKKSDSYIRISQHFATSYDLTFRATAVKNQI